MYFTPLLTLLALAAVMLAAVLFLILEIYVVVVGHVKGAPYVRSKKGKISTMIELAEIKPGDIVTDLGSGDGSILVEAAKRGALGVGVEVNPFLVWHSRRHVRKIGLENKIKIVKSDFREHHLGSTDVVFLYLWPSTLEELRDKFSRELKPGTRVVSNGFPLSYFSPSLSKNGIYVYRV